jgi:hypothetical protein
MNKNDFVLYGKDSVKSAIIIVFFIVSVVHKSSSQDFNPKSDAWYFNNFTTATLSWDDFRETFIGIAPTEAESANFDPLFYDNIYQTRLASPGNCFGMCLLALEMKKNGGCEGYCYPPYLYPGSVGPSQPELSHAINILHGHQINHTAIMYMLDIIAQNYQRDGNYVFSQLQYYLEKDDPCVISVTENWAPGSNGHALIAYKAVTEGTLRKILIYDPNRPYPANASTYYDNQQNFVSIAQDGTWSFTMADGAVWSGSQSTGGNLILFPLSIAGPRDRIPQSLFADISEAVSKILIYGSNVDVNQISNTKGRHLFKPGTKELESDTSKRIKNLLPFVPFSMGQQNGNDKEMLFFYRSNEPLDIDVKNSGSGYTLNMIGSKGLVSVKAINGSGSEKIRMENFNTSAPSVSFINQSNPSYYQIELRSIVKENEKVRIYSIDRFNPLANSPVNLTISREGSGIEIVSEKKISQFDLTVSEAGIDKSSPVKQIIELESGKNVRFSVGKSLDKKKLILNQIR